MNLDLVHWGGVNGQICRVAGGSASVYADNVRAALESSGNSRLPVGMLLIMTT